MISSNATVRPWFGVHPSIDPEAVVMEGVRIIGDVTIRGESSIWYNSVIRGDVHWVRIGEQTSIQDGSVLHVTNQRFPLSIGNRVTVGHAVNLHGCTLEDECLIGIGAVVLDGAVVESGAVVAAGAVVPPGMKVPAGMVVAGVPARVIRPVTAEEREDRAPHALRYVRYAREHGASMPQG